MSEEDIEKKLKEERELRRLNQLKTLGYLGWKGDDPSKMTLEQIEARIELQLKQNEKEQKDLETPTVAFFKGIDGERANVEASQKASPIERTFEEITTNYDALTALIPQIRKNVVKYDNDARIPRLKASIKLNENTSIIRDVVL
jgi:transcriptional regulator with XRE-family HTH domain